MKKLPHYYTRRWFVCSILLLCAMGFAYRLPVPGEALPAALLRYAVPLLSFRLVYRLEYRHRILEQVCRVLKKESVLSILLPIFFSGLAAVLHHHMLLNRLLPLGFLLSQWAAEKDERATFNSRLAALLVQFLLFLMLSLKLTHYSASAVTVAVMGFLFLLQLMVCGSQEDADFWKAVWGLAAMLLWVAALAPDLLQRMLFIAVSEEDARLMDAGPELLTAVRFRGSAELILCELSDLRPHALLWLAARYGWVSLVPMAAVIGVLAVSGFCLCFLGLPRHTSSLAAGCYILLMVQFVSFFLQSIGVVIGFRGLPFFDCDLINMMLAVPVLQALNPKPLSEITADDPDFDSQEVASIILLPRTRQGAEILAQYAFDNHNYLAWTVLLRQFWRHFTESERRALLLNSADLFDTHDYLKTIHPEYYQEVTPCTIPNR